jgi:hypothetical protein
VWWSWQQAGLLQQSVAFFQQSGSGVGGTGSQAEQQPAVSQSWIAFQAGAQMLMQSTAESVALHRSLAHLAADHNAAPTSAGRRIKSLPASKGGIQSPGVSLNDPKHEMVAVVTLAAPVEEIETAMPPQSHRWR